MGIYDYQATTSEGEKVSLESYKGKVLLIINSATECGFTPQYDDLQDIYEKYADQGFEILDFPCNQFGHQAPGTSEEIHLFCSQRFGITFQVFDKIEVNGDNQAPLFAYLKDQKGFEGFNEDHPGSLGLAAMLKGHHPDFETSSDIKWNFTKFLVDGEGRVIRRFEPVDFMETVDEAINELL